jgi:hypothetical protein
MLRLISNYWYLTHFTFAIATSDGEFANGIDTTFGTA